MEATRFIDSDAESAQACVANLGIGDRSDRDRARAVFEYVRDEIAYDFTAPTDPDAYRASTILANGKGHCVRKALLLCALGRTAGLPTALVFSDLRDHTLSDSIVQMMGTDILHHHGLNAFYLDGRWILADATTPKKSAEKKGFRLVAFDGTTDALGAETTVDGTPHLDYVTFHGMHADLPFTELMRSLATGYANADNAKFDELGLSASDAFAAAADAFEA
jgi:transglutaminase-like putative cysteine protease